MINKPDFSLSRGVGSKPNRKIAFYRASRLAAVQALYQIEFSGSADKTVIDEFRLHRLETVDEEVNGGQKANDCLFKELVTGTSKCLEQIDEYITSALDKSWPLKRLPIVMRCILRMGTFELLSKVEVPAGVVVKLYHWQIKWYSTISSY